MPIEYPKMSYYKQNEMSTYIVIDYLGRLKNHNPNIFIILYGGEPLLRSDLGQIVKFCNENDIHYTIISNNTPEVQPFIKQLISEVGVIKGFTSSVDPIVFRKDFKDIYRFNKSKMGFLRLVNMKKIINDVVAEVTIDKEMLDEIIPLVKALTDNGISSDITFIDIAKNKYYDFSNITDSSVLVPKDKKIKGILDTLMDPKYDVLMAKELLPEIYESLPADGDCEFEKNVYNISVDADGSLRLCLRIRGMKTPALKLHDYINKDGSVNCNLIENITIDKAEYCELCNWPCWMQSKILEQNICSSDILIHTDRRQ
jgi:MoaA/NifB/PqqE/SkfB family radical SAM enzyme